MIMIQRGINTSMLLLAKRWVNYVPDWWHVEEINEKMAGSLDYDSLAILLQVQADKKMNEMIDKFLKESDISTKVVYMSSSDAEWYDEICAYVENRIYFNKISADEREYVTMLFKSENQDNKEEIDKAIDLIQSPFIREYAIEARPLKRTTPNNLEYLRKKNVWPLPAMFRP